MHTNRLITPRSLVVWFFCLFGHFLPINLSAQNALQPVAAWLEQYRSQADFVQVSLFQPLPERASLQHIVEGASMLKLSESRFDELLLNAPPALRFTIPTADGQTIELELAQVEILTPEFYIETDQQQNVAYQPGTHYRGILRGDPNSVACISLSSSGVMGMVAHEAGNFTLGVMEDGSGHYIFYKTEHINALSPNNCHADEESLAGDFGDQPPSGDRGVGCKLVQVYFECDYKMYTDNGSSTTNVGNYVSGLFNQVATLYANEDVGIAISQIYVWTSPDAYAGYNSTSAVLNAFRQTRGTSFNGNLAHLLTTRSLGGGIAYVDVVCFKQFAYGVSAVSKTYQNVPTYSWSVEVVTHELGHNLGSWHTHSCNWPTGALDNCVSPEGSCSPGPSPVNGGTIMSYCHLTNHGINFNHGFGPAPGARIRDKVLNGTCLPQSGIAPAGLSATNITNNSAKLNWSPVQGATVYSVQYKLSTAGSWLTAGTSTAATYTLNNLTANSAYHWRVKTDCSNYSNTGNFSTTNSGGGTNCSVATGLGSTNIGANTATLFWNAVSGASSYTVQYKPTSSSSWISAGSSITPTLVLNNLNAATSYQWQVKANCSSWSATANFVTTGGGGGSCNAPSNLVNNTVGSSYASISWNAVLGASNYTLQIKLASGNNWFTLGTVSVTSVVISGLQPNTSYHWRVKANCSDYSGAKLLTTSSNIGGGSAEGLSQPTILEHGAIGTLDLFPNPVGEYLNVRYLSGIASEGQIIVTDPWGRVVFRQTLQPLLNVSTLTPGVYFLSILDGDRRIATERFVKI